ncbi:MAG: hypothetical protein ACRERW_04990, partial [Pseudomonas sp.]
TFYLGALLVVLPAFLAFGNSQHLPSTDVRWLVLLFLGLCPTALGLYWWNKGACLVSGATLAVILASLWLGRLGSQRPLLVGQARR